MAGLIVLVMSVASAQAQTTVTATWDRNTDTQTVGYRVYYGTSSGSYQWSLDTGNQSSAPINVSPGSVYYFAVRAYNATMQYGPASNEAVLDLRATAAPTAQISATLGASNVATVTWQAANATSASINGTAVPLAGSTTVTVTAQTTFTLTARAADGRTASASATVSPSTAPPTAQITATLGANNMAAVSWQTSNAASATINGTTVPLSGSSNVSVTGTTTFTLTARAANGATATSSATVSGAAVPGAPQTMTATVSGSRATMSWRLPISGSAPENYRLDVGTAPGTANIASAYNVGNVLSVYGDLGRGTYYARVRAANSAGISPYSNEVRFSIGRKLRAPTGFSVTWTGVTATLSWTAPAADTAEDLPTNYILEAGTTPGARNVASVNVGSATTFRAEVPSGNYFVRVRAQNALGESDPSEEIEIRAPGTPQAPTTLMQVNATGIVDLRWTASAGGYAATAYLIEAGTAPGLSDLARLNVGNVTRFTTTAPPGVYYIRVRAINDRGMSLPSNEVVVRR
jgi:large repetitive protein